MAGGALEQGHGARGLQSRERLRYLQLRGEKRSAGSATREQTVGFLEHFLSDGFLLCANCIYGELRQHGGAIFLGHDLLCELAGRGKISLVAGVRCGLTQRLLHDLFALQGICQILHDLASARQIAIVGELPRDLLRDIGTNFLGRLFGCGEKTIGSPLACASLNSFPNFFVLE